MSSRPRRTPPSSARLFEESRAAVPLSGVYVANIDGASRGNPGPAAYAVVLRDPAGKIVWELAKRLGRETNNVAEYYALLAALDYAAAEKIPSLAIRSDSELLVRQMQGRYKVKSRELKPLHERASKLARQLGYFTIEHVPRELNREADGLANVALDQGNISSSGASGMNSRSANPPGGESPKVSGPRSVRARVIDGKLVPASPLDFPEGTEVQLDIRILK
jgi:ribonuclease HI